MPGVMHTWVVHKKKRAKIGGKWRWIKPKFVKLHTHYLPPKGRKLVVKAGTQIIDRFWSHLRSHLRSGPRKPGSINLRRRVRSAQWTYWYRRQDLWAKTCEMLKYSFSKFKWTMFHSSYLFTVIMCRVTALPMQMLHIIFQFSRNLFTQIQYG